MLEYFKELMQEALEKVKQYGLAIVATVKWILYSIVVGVLCGLLGSAFHIAVEMVTEVRAEYTWCIFLLPVAGVLIVWMYEKAKISSVGTDAIIGNVLDGSNIPFLLIPGVFIGTVITHLAGGSSGREGAALQMGGGIGFHVANLFHMDDYDRRTMTMCGMAAFFTALFGTPLTATVFVLVVIKIGVIFYSALIPCLAASLTAFLVSQLLGVAPTAFVVTDMPEFSWSMLLRVVVLGAACAFISGIFYNVMHEAGHFAAKLVKNPYLRAAAGGAVLLVLTLLVGSSKYNGAGMSGIATAVEQGMADPWDWLLKLIFTAITLGVGFKGGEVVPSFYIGATFGCVFGSLIGIPAGAAAAMGLAGVFCGATNCAIPSIFLCIELFGAEGLPYYAVVCAMTYALTGHGGLYHKQGALTEKLRNAYIDKL